MQLVNLTEILLIHVISISRFLKEISGIFLAKIRTKFVKIMLELGQDKFSFSGRLVNILVCLFYTLVFFFNIQFGLLVDTC